MLGFLFIPAFAGVGSLIGSLLLSSLPVVLETNEGERFSGPLLDIEDSSLRIEVNGSVRSIEFQSLSSLVLSKDRSESSPVFRVELSDGTRIAAETVSSSEETLEIKPRQQANLRVPLQQVRAIRFQRGRPATDSQWLGWLEQQQRSDLLVIRREGDRLDPQQGLISEIDSDSVGFDLDGTSVDAPIDRLEGVVFATREAEPASSAISVVDVFGSQWKVSDLTLADGEDELSLRLANSLQHRVPLSQVATIRWSSGLVLLATAESVDSGYSPFIKSNVSPKTLNAFFSPTVEGEADLQMHGGSSIVYRVEPGFRILAGSVQRHSKVADGGAVTVRIELDGKEMWRETLEDRRSRGFEIPLTEARRLQIYVDQDGDGDVGDTVQLTRPRLVK